MRIVKIRAVQKAILTSLVLLSGGLNAAPALQLLPEDEGVRDESFVEFRNGLIQAVKNREPERLINYIDPRINNGSVVPRGAQGFAEHWGIDSVDSELWKVLEPILKMGGGFVRSDIGVEFCAPYVFTAFPSDLARDKHAAIIDAESKLMSQPSSNSDLVDTLSHHIVQINDWAAVADANNTANLSWLSVTTLDGKKGYVRSQSVRGPKQYSACFLQREGRGWKMISLMQQ